MRTFHIGGTASRSVEESEIKCTRGGAIRFHNLKVVVNQEGQSVVLNRNGEVVIQDKKDREIERHLIPAGSSMSIKEGDEVTAKSLLCRWDPHNTPILAERSGVARFDDIVEGVTMKQEIDPGSGVRRKVIIEHKGDLHPQVVIEDKDGTPLGLYPIPEKAHIEVDDGQPIVAGTLLAKTPREISGTQDITGGLPRVTELFEARKPKDPAVISDIDGIVELGEKRKGKRTIIVKNESGIEKEHLITQGKHLRVHKGDGVRAGEPLTDGPQVPHDILRINGEEAVQNYLLREVQNVYRSQNVTIDDKHVEIIIGQMMRKVKVEKPGETGLLPGTVIDKFHFRKRNKDVSAEQQRPATAVPLLLGITKASLQSDSFISAASFQETTKVLTEAALAGKVDRLLGLKENVILGHLVPAGTGFRMYHRTRVKKHVLEDVAAESETADAVAQDDEAA
jgi:DNA-directed RNA polymerase subunit beta'